MNKIEKKLVDEFNNIPVPDEALSRVMAGIDDGMNQKKKERDGGHILKMKKKKILKTISAIAAALVITIGLANSTPDISYAMSNIPVAGPLFKVMTFRNFDYENKGYEIKGEQPVIAAENGNEEAKKSVTEVNASINNIINEKISQLKAEEAENKGEGHHSIKIDSMTLSDSEHFKSIKLSIVDSQASTFESNHYYTFSKTTGKLVRLSDLFPQGSDWKGIVDKKVIAQMKEAMKKDKNVHYYLNDPEIGDDNFKGISKDTQFYVDNQDHIHICFDQCEVSPACMGAQDILIK